MNVDRLVLEVIEDMQEKVNISERFKDLDMWSFAIGAMALQRAIEKAYQE